MLAQLLRGLYLFQMLLGGLLGAWLAAPLTHQDGSALAWLLIPLGALGLPLVLQFLTMIALVLRARDGGPLSDWWRAFWGEYIAAIAIFMLRQPWPRRASEVLLPLPGAPNPIGAAPMPVLLVHGFICNHRVWDDVAAALRRAGHPVLAIDLEPLFTSIDDYAGPIELAADKLLACTGAQQLALVGHSMGGLAIRAWLRAHGSGRVAKIITLGSPHQGTHIVKALITANGEQMLWRSAWLQALQDSEKPATRHLMQIALSRQDNVVYPQREQVLSGASVTEFSGLGHLQLCLNPAVINWLVQQLGSHQRDPAAGQPV